MRRVQAGLYAQGYYKGTIDGILGPETKSAIVMLQSDRNLPVTGTITKDVLNALGVQAK